MKNHWTQVHEDPIREEYEKKLHDVKNYMIESIDKFFKMKMQEQAAIYENGLWESANKAHENHNEEEAEKYRAIARSHIACAKAVVEGIFTTEVPERANHLEEYPCLHNPYTYKVT
tara:strand:+ start:91 stop:438 length:348 start_codon:yes stop_codon:yes gene_type:complete